MNQTTDFVLSDFWNWDDFASYLQAEAALVGVLLLLSLAFMRYEWFVDMLGTIALGVEATLGVPQIYRNFVKQSTAGLRYVPPHVPSVVSCAHPPPTAWQ